MKGAERLRAKTCVRCTGISWALQETEHRTDLASLRRLLAQLKYGFATMRQEETLDVVDLRCLDKRRDFGRQQVLFVKQLRSTERSHKRPSAAISDANGD